MPLDGDIPLAKSESIGINLDQILKTPDLNPIYSLKMVIL